MLALGHRGERVRVQAVVTLLIPHCCLPLAAPPPLYPHTNTLGPTMWPSLVLRPAPQGVPLAAALLSCAQHLYQHPQPDTVFQGVRQRHAACRPEEVRTQRAVGLRCRCHRHSLPAPLACASLLHNQPPGVTEPLLLRVCVCARLLWSGTEHSLRTRCWGVPWAPFCPWQPVTGPPLGVPKTKSRAAAPCCMVRVQLLHVWVCVRRCGRCSTAWPVQASSPRGLHDRTLASAHLNSAPPSVT